MPYETRFVDGDKGVHSYGAGIVTSADLLTNALRRTLDEERNSKRLIKYGLIDFSAMTEFQVSRETVKQLLGINSTMSQYSPGALVAIVAPDEFAFGMSRMWASLAHEIGWKANVFRDRELAMQWLRTELGGGNPAACPYDEFPSLRPVTSSS